MSQLEHKIMAALIGHPDGLTVKEIQTAVEARSGRVIEVALSRMYAAYIDRWVDNGKRMVPVYCLVDVPDDCPEP